MVTGTERQKILADWNNTRTSYPRDFSIQQVFEKIAEENPTSAALEFEGECLTYDALNQQANKLAHYLISQGVKFENPVGICMDRSPEMVIGLLGILKAGGAYVPIDPLYPHERIEYLVKDSGVSQILCHKRLADRFMGYDGTLIFLDEISEILANYNAYNPKPVSLATSMAYIIYTSGSTGKPKGSSVLNRGVVRLVKNTNYLHFYVGDVFMQFASISFDASTFEIWGCLLNGGKLVIVPPGKTGLDELADIIIGKKISVLWLTTGLFHLMVDQKTEALTSARVVLTGGDVLSANHAKQFFEKTDHLYMINAYGPTENTAFTTCYRLTPQTDFSKPIPIGKPIANTEVYIVDENMEPVAIGEKGELLTGGDGLAREYHGQPELTAQKFVKNPFKENANDRLYRTGDLVSYRDDGNIDFLGRIDQQVKIRGYRIELGELETVISGFDQVRQAVVVAREDRPGEKYLCCYFTIAADTNGHGSIGSAIKKFLVEKIPGFMIPSAFVEVSEFKMTSNGKIDRKSLPKPQPQRTLDSICIYPDSKKEHLLARIWESVLNISPVGVTDNFFALGGNSISAMRVIARIATEMDTHISAAQFFEHPTIREITVLNGETSKPDISVSRMPVQHEYPLTSNQLVFLMLEQFGRGAAYNAKCAYRIDGDIDLEQLKQAFALVIEKHIIFKTRFVTDGEPYQVHDRKNELQLEFHDLSFEENPVPRASEELCKLGEGHFNLDKDFLFRSILCKVDAS